MAAVALGQFLDDDALGAASERSSGVSMADATRSADADGATPGVCATHGVPRAAGAAGAVCRLMVRPGAPTSQGLRGALRLVGRGLRRRNSAPRRVLAAGDEERVTQRVTRRARRRFSRGP